ncbi:MAG: MaoC family dehydratase [Actinobacteria bacterium]|jgi:acyl dehydratase|nr:MaoC family dehydratase [Actinomycetota bacterium]NBP91270.1 MaoC family dehydratase [Actinomycetota bacterium]
MLTPEISALVGKSISYTAPEPVGKASIRYFAMAIGDANPLYTDEEYARRHGYSGVIAPPTWVCETNQYAGLAMDADGYAGHLWKIEVPNTRLVRGGNDYHFHQAIVESDVITATWVIDSITERTNSKGLKMMTMFSTATYTNQKNELLATNTESLIWSEIPR